MSTIGLPGEISHCGLCGSWDLKLILDMGLQPLAEQYDGDAECYPLRLLECQACTLVQLSFIADPRKVFTPGHTYASGNTEALRDHFTGLAEYIGRLAGPGQLVMDIGCNDGTLLEAVRNEVPDMQVLGVEPTGQAKACAAKGIPVWENFFSAEVGKGIRELNGPAKIVTACNVLAHVPDPHDFMTGVMHLLADDGIFVTENHDVNSVLDGLQIDTIYHEHARYYSVSTLSQLLAMHGLVVMDTEKISTHGGSFRVIARRQRSSDLGVRAWALSKNLKQAVSTAAELGPVYGIGATTRATPLIHYARIAGHLTCVCEVPGSAKIGMVMPGTSIPIVDEAKLIADQPPSALLLSWHWKDSIIPALRRKGYGGKFIVPLPRPEIVSE